MKKINLKIVRDSAVSIKWSAHRIIDVMNELIDKHGDLMLMLHEYDEELDDINFHIKACAKSLENLLNKEYEKKEDR